MPSHTLVNWNLCSRIHRWWTFNSRNTSTLTSRSLWHFICLLWCTRHGKNQPTHHYLNEETFSAGLMDCGMPLSRAHDVSISQPAYKSVPATSGDGNIRPSVPCCIITRKLVKFIASRMTRCSMLYYLINLRHSKSAYRKGSYNWTITLSSVPSSIKSRILEDECLLRVTKHCGRTNNINALMFSKNHHPASPQQLHVCPSTSSVCGDAPRVKSFVGGCVITNTVLDIYDEPNLLTAWGCPPCVVLSTVLPLISRLWTQWTELLQDGYRPE